MLKHATPRSSPCLSSTSSGSLTPSKQNSSFGRCSLQEDQGRTFNTSQLDPNPKDSNQLHSKSSFNERGVDCDGIVKPLSTSVKKAVSSSSISSFLGDRILNLSSLSAAGSGIGPVITHGKAIVRRGLSFNSKKDSDSVSVRSVKSEGQGIRSDEAHKVNLIPKSNSVMALQTNSDQANDGGDKIEKQIDKVNEVPPSQENSTESSSGSPSSSSSEKKTVKHSHIRSASRKIFGLSKNDHPSLKSLLRLPGVYGHIPVPESAPCGTPHVLSPDSLSLNSSDSFVSSNSGRISARSWSSNTSSNSNNTSDSCNSNCSSSSEPSSTTLKIFAKCLRSDIEYKTVNIGSRVTCRQLINLLLSKARMRHRDPHLFYLTMEVTVRRWSGVPVRALLVLEESARPAQLALCRPTGDLKFVLQMRRGGVIKIHDTVLMPGSQYKSLLVSYRTTVEETVQLLLNCYCRRESKNYYALHEVCQSPNYSDRRLDQSEKPLEVKAEWPRDRTAEFVFVLRRNMTHALSLRKLSLRTSENRSHKNEERNLPDSSALPVKSELMMGFKKTDVTRHASERPQAIEETLIDCTSTTPVMRTLTREEGIQMSASDGSSSKIIMVQEQAHERPKRLDPNAYITTHTHNKEKVNKEDYKETNKTEIIPDTEVIVNRKLNFRSKVTFHSLPNPRKPSDLTSQTYPGALQTDDKESLHGTEFLDIISKQKSHYSDPTSFVTSTRQQPYSSQDVEERRKNPEPPKFKIVSTSAVQTELTCIPIKDLKSRQKWNSVETLLDTKRPLEMRQKVFRETALNGDFHCDTGKNITELTLKKQTLPAHSPSRHCDCKKCFYI